MSQFKTIIIGGEGQMGQLFNQLLVDQGLSVQSFSEPDWENTQKLDLVSNADWVIISVPISMTESVIEKTCLHLNDNAVLSDLTSVKAVPQQTMLQYHAGPVLALHPMFGPIIQNPFSQYALVECGGRDRVAYQPLLDILNNIGFRVYYLSANEHDRLMDVIQAGHYLLLDIEQKQRDQDDIVIDVIDYSARGKVIDRYCCEDPALYQSIIYFDQRRADVLKDLPKLAQEIAGMIQNSHHLDKFQQQMTAYFALSFSPQKSVKWTPNLALHVFLLLVEMRFIQVRKLNLKTLSQFASPSFQQRLSSMSQVLNLDLSVLSQYQNTFSHVIGQLNQAFNQRRDQ